MNICYFRPPVLGLSSFDACMYANKPELEFGAGRRQRHHPEDPAKEAATSMSYQLAFTTGGNWNANTDFLWDRRTGLAAKTVNISPPVCFGGAVC